MANEHSPDQAQTLIALDYMAMKMRVTSIVDETPDIKTFRLAFCDAEQGAAFTFRAGQFDRR